MSDKYITQHSDFLHRIEPGDMVLADRGFNIAEDLTPSTVPGVSVGVD